MRSCLFVLLLVNFTGAACFGQSKSIELPAAGYSFSWHPAVSRDGTVVAFSSDGQAAGSVQPGGLEVWAIPMSTGLLELVSAGHGGRPANNHSFQSSLSVDGRFVAFDSGATDLTADINGVFDIFVRDRLIGATEKVSINANGEEANGASNSAFITPNGRYVSFNSTASNLVSGDTNNAADVFIFDRATKTIERVSVGDTVEANGASTSPSVSDDGRFVSFMSTASNLINGRRTANWGVYVRDRTEQKTELISAPAAGFSWRPAISGNGRFVTFESNSPELDPAAGSSVNHIYVYDRALSTVERISKGHGGEADGGSSFPQITADGGHIVFFSSAENLTPFDTNRRADLFLYDSSTHSIENLTTGSPLAPVTSIAPSISADGKVVAFAASYLGRTQVAVWSNRPHSPQSHCSQFPLTLPAPKAVYAKRIIKIELLPLPCEATYKIELRNQKRRQTLRKSTRIPRVTFKKVPKGTYKLTYKVVLPNQPDRSSRPRTIKIK